MIRVFGWIYLTLLAIIGIPCFIIKIIFESIFNLCVRAERAWTR